MPVNEAEADEEITPPADPLPESLSGEWRHDTPAPVRARGAKPKRRRRKKRRHRKDNTPVVEPLVVRPRVARAMLGNCSQFELYRKLARGDLDSYLDNNSRRRLISVESIRRDIQRQLDAAASTGFQPTRGARTP
jgi:hypothetical protein